MKLREVRESHPLVHRYFNALPEGEGESWLHRITELDRYWAEVQRSVPQTVLLPGSELPHDAAVEGEYDLFYAGGTLGLLHAVVMARGFGRSVLVADRHVAGRSTRDWNISRRELRQLEATGIFSASEIDGVIVRRYRTGWVEFAAEPSVRKRLYIDEVLDCALDADKLLGLAREKLSLDPASRVLDYHSFSRCFTFSDHVVVELLDRKGGRHYVKASCMVDAMGVLSPVAMQLNKGRPHTHVCPTVGTIASGFADADYDVGEILASTGPADLAHGSGRQLIWEGFPAKDDEYITYLFFYDALESDNDKSLLSLFEEYFARIGEYKKLGDTFRVHRPVFGIIPAYSHDGFQLAREVSADRVVLLGDAAALNSPLTFCGFGSLVRNLPRMTGGLHDALESGDLSRQRLASFSAYEPNVASMANLMKYMCFDRRTDAPNFVNELMNEVMIVLDELPVRYRQAMFRDEMQFDELWTVLLKVAARYPAVLKATWDKLGVKGSSVFLKNLAGWKFSSTR